MATLKEYFLKDFANSLTADFNWQILEAPTGDINVKVGFDMYSSAKFVACYIPKHPHHLQLFAQLIDSWPDAINRSNNVEVISGFMGDVHVGIVGSTHSVFSNRIYIYSEDPLKETDILALDELCKTRSIWLTIRGNAYMEKKLELEKPLAFISHDTRDKTDIAAPIALGLQKLLCPVWYDEYSLKIGDNLRETIERGLKETKRCILILSPNFLSNNGWTKTEFDSVFTREIMEGNGIVLPVWHNVSRKDVYEYSPSLANRVAANWRLGAEEVVRRLYRVIMAR